MNAKTAISLIQVAMEVVVHHKVCLHHAECDVPCDLLTTALSELDAQGIDTSNTRAWFASHGVELPQTAQPNYHRRSNNQVSAEVETVIRDLLGKGWNKSAIAKQLKVNRRVVIRVARESAERTETSKSNRMKTGNTGLQEESELC